MHLYNAWLPPPVADESKKERESFSRVVSSVKSSYRPDDPDSVYSTLKWVSVIDLSVFLSFISIATFIYCFWLNSASWKWVFVIVMWLKLLAPWFKILLGVQLVGAMYWTMLEAVYILAMQFHQGKKWSIFGRYKWTDWIWIGIVSCIAK